MTTRKLRACKYGNRVNGKCPKKPTSSTSSSTRKLRKCKYGERLSNGKCPKKIETKKHKTPSSKSSTITSGIGNMDTKFLVKIHSSDEFKKKKNAMMDMLGESLIMDADAELQGNTMEMTTHTITFELVHQTIDDSNGTYNRENIIKAIKSELGNVEVTVTRM